MAQPNVGTPSVLGTLTDEQLANFREFFHVFDLDGDDSVTVNEIGKALRALGVKVDENELQEMMNQVDMDGNGTMDFEEFVSVLVRRMKDGDCVEELRNTFKVLDLNGDGFVSASEIRIATMKLGLRVTEQDAKEILRLADIDGDGELSFEDFAATMSNKF